MQLRDGGGGNPSVAKADGRRRLALVVQCSQPVVQAVGLFGGWQTDPGQKHRTEGRGGGGGE